MSTVKTNKIWNGMNVVEETDTTTGIIRIYRPTKDNPMGSVLSISGRWFVETKNENRFRTSINNSQRTQGKQPSLKNNLEKVNENWCTRVSIKIDIDVLNNRSNYSSEEE